MPAPPPPLRTCARIGDSVPLKPRAHIHILGPAAGALRVLYQPHYSLRPLVDFSVSSLLSPAAARIMMGREPAKSSRTAGCTSCAREASFLLAPGLDERGLGAAREA